jgi:hypothetical protein
MKHGIALFAAFAFLLTTLAPAAPAADKNDKEIRGAIASISKPDDKGIVTITVMDGSRKDRHVVTITIDSNTKILENKKPREVAALAVRQQVNVTGEQPATQIEILPRSARRDAE